MSPTTRPLVSIVTPTLDQGRFIEQTLRSVREQTYPHLEHIVVDGGSSDGTLEVLRRHEGAYPMRWLSEPDEGMYDAVNKGMRQAQGDILAYLNSDDLYFPWTLEVVVDAFERHPEADLVFGDALGIHEESGREEIKFQPQFTYDFLRRAGSLVQPAVFWRRSVGEQVGDFDASLRLVGDLDFWLRAGPVRVYHRVDEMLAVERDHASAKRLSQWDALMSESRTARDRVDDAHPVRRQLGLVTGRYRAWWGRRVLWLRFARASQARGRDGHDPSAHPWARFLAASELRLSPAHVLVAQLPWIGQRIAAGSVRSGVDWLHGGDRREAPAARPSQP